MLNENQRDLFLGAIAVTIQHWPSFQIAVNNGMGGPNTEEKVNWLCSMIVDLFNDNPDGSVQADDVLEYMSEVINNEFDTIIEDGSAEMICSSIVAYYTHILAGNKDFVLAKLETLKQKQALLNAQNQQSDSVATQSSPSNFNVTSKEASSSGDAEMTDSNEPDPDGWTVVRRKR